MAWERSLRRANRAHGKELDPFCGVREGFPGEVIFVLRSEGGVGENYVKGEG